MKKKILVVGTGGTIASKQSEDGLVPVLSAEELLNHVPDVKTFADIETVQVFNLDSTDVRPNDWLLIADVIRKQYDGFDGFVVTHGTDTLAYTAAAISYLIQNSGKPIVVTGAQKPIDAEDTDARINLRDSILYASDEKACGVTIVFDGKVIAGTRAKKEKSKSYDAFSSINYPNLAVIQDGKVIHYINDNYEGSPLFYDKVSDKVFVLKLTPGFDSSILPILFEKFQCIIIESFGVGGIPTYLMEEFSNQIESSDCIVIITTQVANEGSDMDRYQVGRSAKLSLGLLETYDMTPESAFAKACWLLGQDGLSRADILAHFHTPIGHDTISA